VVEHTLNAFQDFLCYFGIVLFFAYVGRDVFYITMRSARKPQLHAISYLKKSAATSSSVAKRPASASANPSSIAASCSGVYSRDGLDAAMIASENSA
jgi:hypothetical protein